MLNFSCMEIVLLFPPQAQPFLPHSALPALKAYIQKNSSHLVHIRDLNIEAYEYFLSEEFISLEGAAPSGSIERARKVLHSGEEFYEPHSYYQAIETLQGALARISERYPGTRMDLKDFTTEYSTSSSEQIIKATKDHTRNPFIDFFQKKNSPGDSG